jgi:hypothetical protein
VQSIDSILSVAFLSVDVPQGVAAKLRRAEAHLAQFGLVVEEFLASEPFAAVRTVSSDGRSHVVEWTRTAPIPDDIPLLAGDAVHNLRSALDHLAVALERSSAVLAGHPLTPAQERRPQFPVARSEGEFEEQMNRFRHLSPATIEVLKAFQPFVITPAQPEQSFLWQVSDLDNLDKHRMLAPVPISPVSITGPGHGGQWVDGPSVPYAPGVEIGRYVFADPTAATELPIEFRFGLTLGSVPWVPHDVRFRLGEYAKTVKDGVIVPICRSVNI